MRTVDLRHPCPQPGQEARTARLTRHLEARLLDFAPGGPEVLSADQAAGLVLARFPGRDTAGVLAELAARGVLALPEGEGAAFLLSPGTAFEDLDYLWGCLNDILT